MSLLLAQNPYKAPQETVTLLLDSKGNLSCEGDVIKRTNQRMTQFHPLDDTEYLPQDLYLGEAGRYIGELRIYYPNRMPKYYELYLTKEAAQEVSFKQQLD